ncbi:MAG: hypothetical protein ACUVQP_08515, partial [Bacteroidales bacterium]
GLDTRRAGDIWVFEPGNKDANLPNFLYEAKVKLKTGRFPIPFGLTVEPKGSIEGLPKNALEHSRFHQKGLGDIVLRANSQEEAVDGVKKYLDNYISELAKKPNEKAAKGLRAAINRTMYNVAGVDPKLGKYQSKIFAEAFNNPDISNLLETLDEYKNKVDRILTGQIKKTDILTGVSKEIPEQIDMLEEISAQAPPKSTPNDLIGIKNEIERLKKEQKAIAPNKKAYNQLTEGDKTLYNQLEKEIARLSIKYDNLKKAAGNVSPEEISQPIAKEKITKNIPTTTPTAEEAIKGEISLDERVKAQMTPELGEEIKQRVKARPAEEIIKEIEAGTYQPRKKTIDTLKTTEILGGQPIKKSEFNKQMAIADQDLKSKYNLKSATEFFNEQEEASQKLTEAEMLNIKSGLPPQGLPSQPTPIKPSKAQAIKNLSDQLIKESRDILNDMGEAGKQLATRLDNMNNAGERMAGNLIADYKNLTKNISEIELERILKYLDGQDINLTSKESIVANGLRKQLNKIADEAIKNGLEIKLPNGTKIPFSPLEDYIPHMIDREKLKMYADETVDYLLKTGQMTDEKAATDFVNDLIKGMKVTDAYQRYFGQNVPRRFGNLEFARLVDFPKEVLRYDKNLIPEYLEGASRRIHEVKNFGPNDEILINLLNNLEKNGYDARVADEIMKRNLGIIRENPALAEGVKTIRQIEAATKLGLSAISNLGQSVNTASKFGIRNTLKNIFKSASPEAQEFALRSGATVESAIRQIKEEMGGEGKLSKIIAPGFNVVERFNRIVAANTGKDFVEQRFKAFLKNPYDPVALEDLKKMIDNFNPEKALKLGKLTEEQLQQAAQKAVELTQFKTRPIDLPPTWSSLGGRLLTQFKTFSYKHGQFIKDEVLMPAIRGKNYGPLIRYLILGLIVGEGIADVKAFIRGRERPTNLVERALDNLASVGGFGLLQDVMQTAQRGPEAVLNWIAGPTTSDVAKLAGGTGLALQGKPKTLGRFALGNIPIIGQPLANTIFPPRGAYKTRTPDLIQEGIGIEIKDEKTIGSQAAQKFVNDLGISPLDEQKIKDQIKNIQEQKKKIIGNKGFLGIGKMQDEEKNEKLRTLEAEEKVLKSALKLQGIEDYLKPNDKTGIEKYKYRSEQLNWARKVYESDLPEEKKDSLYKKMNLNKYEVQYD